MDFSAIFTFIMAILNWLGLINNTESTTKSPCDTPFGSPCGPTALCSATTETSFVCKESIDCPAGCGIRETCENGVCVCRNGYYRALEQIPCMPNDRNVIVDTSSKGFVSPRNDGASKSGGAKYIQLRFEDAVQ